MRKIDLSQREIRRQRERLTWHHDREDDQQAEMIRRARLWDLIWSGGRGISDCVPSTDPMTSAPAPPAVDLAQLFIESLSDHDMVMLREMCVAWRDEARKV
jgi:hypothetical protein